MMSLTNNFLNNKQNIILLQSVSISVFIALISCTMDLETTEMQFWIMMNFPLLRMGGFQLLMSGFLGNVLY